MTREVSSNISRNTFLALDSSTSLWSSRSLYSLRSGGSCHAHFAWRETVRLHRFLDNGGYIILDPKSESLEGIRVLVVGP